MYYIVVCIDKIWSMTSSKQKLLALKKLAQQKQLLVYILS